MKFSIVAAQTEHLPHLPAIERAAAALFPAEDLSPALRDAVVGPEVLRAAQAAGQLHVALVDGKPVGSALTHHDHDNLHLEELSVHPAHGRQGIGRALVEAVLADARSRGCRTVSLITFRHLPWNAPFYESAGFQRVAADELSPFLRKRLAEERTAGLEMEKRVAMCYHIAA